MQRPQPLCFTFPHPEFLKPDTSHLSPPAYGCKQELHFKIFKIISSDINFLKTENSTTTNIAAFNVLVALIWCCIASSLCDIRNSEDRVSTILYAMDIRSKLNPPLLSEYCGNAILLAYASAKCKEIKRLPFSKMVEMVSDGFTRTSDEYAKSVIDWLEINKGCPCGDCIVSSWLRLGLRDIVFSWGKPVYCGPVVSRSERLCWIFPDVDGTNVFIQWPAEEMERFQFHFHDFFGAYPAGISKSRLTVET